MPTPALHAIALFTADSDEKLRPVVDKETKQLPVHAGSKRRAELPPYRERQESQQGGENDEIDNSLAIGGCGGTGESELRSDRGPRVPDERGVANRPGN